MSCTHSCYHIHQRFHSFSGWMVGCLAGWLTSWLPGWLTGCIEQQQNDKDYNKRTDNNINNNNKNSNNHERETEKEREWVTFAARSHRTLDALSNPEHCSCSHVHICAKLQITYCIFQCNRIIVIISYSYGLFTTFIPFRITAICVQIEYASVIQSGWIEGRKRAIVHKMPSSWCHSQLQLGDMLQRA